MNKAFIQQQFKKHGLAQRLGQEQMMEAVSSTIAEKKIAVIEGGTGIGKTLGYLIPALLNKKSGQKIVLATATVSLQLQLMDKDLPLVSQLLDMPVKAEIAKGRRRYVCLNRLYHHSASEQIDLELLGIRSENTDDDQIGEVIDMLIAELEKGWTGDKDILRESITEKQWQRVSTDAAGCSGRRCSYVKECPFFRAKNRLKVSDVIVANHDILLSDLSLGSGVLLPDSELCIYIIDEAHHFPAKAINHFAASTTLYGARAWLNRINHFKKRFGLVLSLSPEHSELLDQTLRELSQYLIHAHALIHPNFHEKAEEGTWLVSGQLEILKDVSDEVIRVAKQLQSLLYTYRKELKALHNEKTLPDFEALIQALGFFVTRNHGLIRSWELFMSSDNPSQPPVARWITERATKDHAQDIQIHAAYTCSSRILPSFLWERAENGVILSSATLRSLGHFERFTEKAGLTGNPRLITEHFDSPFDYSKSILNIPKMKHMPSGQENEAFVQEVISKLPDLLGSEKAGVLVLYTSHWMMSRVFDQLDDAFKQDILMQGMLSKRELIKVHKKQVDSGHRSVIFGLQSFAEGVDLPGDYCNHVVITKLPFAVPTTPIESTRVKWLEAQGRNAFMEQSLPEASLKLTQFTGRLVRSESDYGHVTVLDYRLVSKHYGKELLENLPGYHLQA